MNDPAVLVDPRVSTSWLEQVASHAHSGIRALVMGDGSAWTYAELLDKACGAASWLDTVGADTGVPIPLFAPTGPEAVALLLAGAMTGRPIAPLSPRFAAPELAACIGRLPPGPILTVAEHHAALGPVAELVDRRLVVIPADFPASRPSLDLDRSPTAVMAVVHTSGTTGLPKAVYQTQYPLSLRVRQSADPIELEEGSVYATASAFHHQAGVGLVLVALGAGATLVALPRFSVESWKALEPLAPTHATVVPALIETLLAANALYLPSLEWIQYGSSPIHPETAKRLLVDYPKVRLVQQMGQTEGSPLTTLGHQDHVDALASAPHRLESVGRPVPGSELRIEDPDAEGIGEICSRAEHYFAPDADGWLRTGDMGRKDDDGFVYIVGRRNDGINRGGETVYPVEVERIIEGHPQVREVAVAGRPDRRLGQVPHAFVVPVDPDDPPGVQELMAFARERLARFKVPYDWHFVTDLPRNPSGKVLRRVLADPGEK
jgi:acyl-CoA synthetase (AMP-forming)/AMP-acid ligase II